MKIFVVGTGLIGGSFSLAIQEVDREAEIYGIDINKEHVEKAKELGVVHHVAEFKDLSDADVVIVSIPVNKAVQEISAILDAVGDDTLVMDVGSTKEQICKAVANHSRRRNFLATHPIAGTEFSGPAAAINYLYKGKTNIICEVEKTAFRLQERALDLFSKIGMRIRYMDSVSHDKHIAYVSHLSHISSFMLGKTVIEKEKNERDIFDLAGSGFASTVRLAKSSPEMWTPIFRENKENVVETLDEYIRNLTHFKELMEADKFEDVHAEMKNTNHIKNILKGIK